MSIRGKPGAGPASSMSLIPDVAGRIDEGAFRGAPEGTAAPDSDRMGRKLAAIERRAAAAERALQEVRAAFEKERAGAQMRHREAEAYAEEISERLIRARDAFRLRAERASAEQAAKDQVLARTKAELATALKTSADMRSELAQEKARAASEQKIAAELADKLKVAETATRATQAQSEDLKRQLEEASSNSEAQRSELARALKQKDTAEQQAAHVRNMISFRLGSALIQAGASWRGAIALPGALAGLIRDGRRRKQGRRAHRVAMTGAEPAHLVAAAGHEQRRQALSILDEMSEASWGAELKLFRIVRDNWARQIDGSKSDFAFLESCWKGNGGAWEYAFTSPGLKHANAQALLELIAHLRRRQMKIAFWNKEDPMHYDRFLPIARQADIIFTTDASKVPDYRRDIPSARIEVMPFAAQPRLCNPAERTRIEQETLCFAGSYYAVGHDARKLQMDALLPAIIDFRGAIYDRMSGIEGDRYLYPPQYRPFIRPAVTFAEMVKLYRTFKVFLNVNTITDSPTMMSRRVYEILACGTPVVSAPSEALERTFPGIVQLASNKSQANNAVGKLLDDAPFRERIAHLGYREVMRNHTYGKRLGTLLPPMGIPHSAAVPLVSIVLCTMRPHLIDRIVENLTQQNYERIEIIVVAQGFSHQQKERLANSLASRRMNIERVEIVTDDSARTLGERFNHGVSLSRGAYIAKMDDDDLYFENYLSDMMLPFSFGDYGLVGKKEIFMYLEGSKKLIRRYAGLQHRTTDFVTGATIVARRDVLKAVPFASANRGEDSAFIEGVRAAGYAIYSTDPYNFCVWRHAQGGQHTWKAADGDFLKSQHTTIEGDHLDVARVCL
jgi:glycosyltransferase involved in cell wall biosynthesis